MKQLVNVYSQRKSIRKLREVIKKINKSHDSISKLVSSGKSYSEITSLLKSRYLSGESIDKILPDAFALCRIASQDVMGMFHYDVQLLGGLILHKGSVAEMKTGEGKTLVATLPAYLNSLTGNQVHVVTVNDYLAKRDSELMSPLYQALGLTSGYVSSDMETSERAVNYNYDILYATSSQLGFDYLRDNMSMNEEEILQKRGLNFAIVDEVDSILIDDARTPLVISGQSKLNPEIPTIMNSLASEFSIYWKNEHSEKDLHDIKKDVILDEKNKDAKLTENGFEKLELLLIENNLIESVSDLYAQSGLYFVTAFTTAMKAIYLYKKETDYLIHDGKIKIVNQSTGRIEEGRRWSDGLHQAVEVKEGVEVKPDNQTMGSISLQNFFRMYDKLSGMSGTAYGETEEFSSVYGMGVVVVPTHKPVARKDLSDIIYENQESKFKAIIKDIKTRNKKSQPVLIGTSSVDESSVLSEALFSNGIKHRILNAKNHEQEADIIAEAGSPGAVTVATNMAGRGTDILLGGNLNHLISMVDESDFEAIKIVKDKWHKSNKKVIDAGGLHVIGTSRNESRRIDNQLIGRSGRQGDPGSSRFYISLDDKIMRLFGGGKYTSAIRSLGLSDENGVSHSLINKAIVKSQSQIESYHSGVRKELLKYDDVANLQRSSIYEIRKKALTEKNSWPFIYSMGRIVLNKMLEKYMPKNTFIEMWDVPGMEIEFENIFNIKFDISGIVSGQKFNNEDYVYDILERTVKSTIDYWKMKVDKDVRDSISKEIFLVTIDKNWRDQIYLLEQLREGIHLRSYAQKNPLQEYSKDALSLFEVMISEIQSEFIKMAFIAFPDLIKRQEDSDSAFLDFIEKSSVA